MKYLIILILLIGFVLFKTRISSFTSYTNKVYLVTFAHNCCVQAQEYLEKTGLEHGCDKVYSLNLDTLDAPENVKDYIKNNKRGAGYWIWKPYALKQIMKSSNKDDIIIYVDSGTYFNKKITNILDFINTYSILCFKHEGYHKQSEWTKYNAVRYMYPENNTWCETGGKNNQFMAAFCGVKNNENGNLLVDKFLDVLKPENASLFDDTPSTVKNCDGFKESRHDQQMLSLLLYKYFNYIPFPTYSKEHYGWVWHEKVNGKDRYL